MNQRRCIVWLVISLSISSVCFSQTADDPARSLVLLVNAVSNNDTNALRQLMGRGIHVNERFGKMNETPLFRAAFWGKMEVACMLIDAGADPLIRDTAGNTPFHYAVSRNHKAVAEMLLAKGCVSDSTNALGQTPLLLAAREGSEDTALWMLDLGADPNVHGKDISETALYYAESHGQTILARALLKKGAHVDVKASLTGWSPLHAAVVRGNANAVSDLLASGCDIDPTDEHGTTPLLLGVAVGQGDQSAMVDLLVSAGADIKKRDDNERTVVDLAQKRMRKRDGDMSGTPASRAAFMAASKKLLDRVQYHYAKRPEYQKSHVSPIDK